jgi:hypothetical protein
MEDGGSAKARITVAQCILRPADNSTQQQPRQQQRQQQQQQQQHTMANQRWAASLDMYRKVPMDLLEGTKRGSILSYLAVLGMLTLFLLETKAYFDSRYV